MTTTELWAMIVFNLQPIGRANAISIAVLRDRLTPELELAASTLRCHLVMMQHAGYSVLTSPLAGVWIAADDDERLDVLEELRGQVQAIERRMAAINQGKCALRTCRAVLPRKVLRRGGLYCSPGHRYRAAIARAS